MLTGFIYGIRFKYARKCAEHLLPNILTRPRSAIGATDSTTWERNDPFFVSTEDAKACYCVGCFPFIVAFQHMSPKGPDAMRVCGCVCLPVCCLPAPGDCRTTFDRSAVNAFQSYTCAHKDKYGGKTPRTFLVHKERCLSACTPPPAGTPGITEEIFSPLMWSCRLC